MSGDTWKVLITGPIDARADWLEAARNAGWEALEAPLLERVPLSWELGELERPSCIALTSTGALEALQDLARVEPSWRSVPVATVGERTAQRVRDLGFEVELVPAGRDAKSLAEALVKSRPEGPVLWLRGERALDLGELLDAGGVAVEERVVYATRPASDLAPPEADVVFFASPSAVAVWRELATGRVPGALAMGWTTLEALQEAEREFSFALPLITPEPVSLTVALDAIAAAP
jgi:uroporphyrinogen-III synthase